MNIIYIRTSTEEQEPENQIKDCKLLLNGEYILLQDKQTAFKDLKERKGFEEAKKLIRQGRIKHFIVWDLDRIFRNRKRLKEFFEFCKINKCGIHSVNQKWLEDLNKIPEPFNEIMHELMLNLMGWLAEDESKKKSDRVKLAVRSKNGKTISYKGNKWGRKAMHTNKINRIKELANTGLSYRKIAEQEKVSIGKISQILSVHKTIQEKQGEKPIIK
ncbi:MAG TPA: recombinase family protein [Ignavibacteria bacterium]|nr:recombinase family protein [Ignavibacteria bacterium]